MYIVCFVPILGHISNIRDRVCQLCTHVCRCGASLACPWQICSMPTAAALRARLGITSMSRDYKWGRCGHCRLDALSSVGHCGQWRNLFHFMWGGGGGFEGFYLSFGVNILIQWHRRISFDWQCINSSDGFWACEVFMLVQWKPCLWRLFTFSKSFPHSLDIV